MKRSFVLVFVVMWFILLATSAGATGNAGISFAFGQSAPDSLCTDPPEFLTQPTISGTPAIGQVITSTSGSVYCATSFEPHFLRTDSGGNIVATDKIGAVQSCPDNSTCTKSDTYTVAPADAGYYLKVTWNVWNHSHPPVSATTGLLGPVPPPPPPPPPLNAITYAVYVDNVHYRDFEVRYPGCDGTALCANVSSGVEPQPGSGMCPILDVSASNWSATGGSLSTLTPPDGDWHQAGNNYTNVTSPVHSETAWQFRGGGGSACTDEAYWIVSDQGHVPPHSGFPAIVAQPPRSMAVDLSYQTMNSQNQGSIFVPALWTVGDFTQPPGDSWIEVGYFSGRYCVPNATQTFFYVETVNDRRSAGALTCQKVLNPPCAGPNPVGRDASADGNWNICFYGPAVAQGASHHLELRYVGSR